MVKLTRIYTRSGDGGKTSLADGTRVPKTDPYITAMGGVDEVNAAIGVARLHCRDAVETALARIQNDLFDLGADLATPLKEGGNRVLRITAAQVERLESEVDAINAALAPLESFVLPGGTAAAAHLHLARATARRAEGLAVALAERETVNPEALRYLNRLSDLLFVLARSENDNGGRDVLWRPGATR